MTVIQGGVELTRRALYGGELRNPPGQGTVGAGEAFRLLQGFLTAGEQLFQAFQVAALEAPVDAVHRHQPAVRRLLPAAQRNGHQRTQPARRIDRLQQPAVGVVQLVEQDRLLLSEQPGDQRLPAVVCLFGLRRQAHAGGLALGDHFPLRVERVVQQEDGRLSAGAETSLLHQKFDHLLRIGGAVQQRFLPLQGGFQMKLRPDRGRQVGKGISQQVDKGQIEQVLQCSGGKARARHDLHQIDIRLQADQ